MSYASKPVVSPLANLISGQIFDKRYLQTTVEQVITAVKAIDPELGAKIEETNGYSIIVEPLTLAMIKQFENNAFNPDPKAEYQPRHPHHFGGLNAPMNMYGGMGPCTHFGIIPNGSDRVLVIPAINSGMGMVQPHLTQMTAMSFDLTINAMNGKGQTDNKGFVQE